MKKKFTQIGVTALRGPDGSFLPAVPLYHSQWRVDEQQHNACGDAEQHFCGFLQFHCHTS